MFKGYRTYLTIVALIIHQILKANGFDQFTGETISLAIDTILSLLAILFRYLAPKK